MKLVLSLLDFETADREYGSVVGYSSHTQVRLPMHGVWTAGEKKVNA
jgi:hypothetical protein